MRTKCAQDSQGRLLTSDGRPSNFHINEFACRGGGCGPWDIDQALVDGLDQLRVLGGLPLKIISGVRCPQHNTVVGGARESQHLPDEAGIGGAADVQFYLAGAGKPAVDSVRTYLLSLRIPQIGGRGLGSTYVHLDTRTVPAEWLYNGSGKTPAQLIRDLVGPAL